MQNQTGNKPKTMMNRMRNLTRKVGNAGTAVAAKAMNLGYRLKNKYNSTFQTAGGKRKTRKMRKTRRATKRVYKMRGRGMINTLRQKLTPSEETKETLRQATFAITPSQAKQNWMKNKAGKAANLTMRGVKGVGKGISSVGKGIAKSPIILGDLLVEATR
jgi:hypothetical protein